MTPRARSLRSIVEVIMLDIMVDLPEMETKGRYIVTEDVVKGVKPLFDKKLADKKSA